MTATFHVGDAIEVMSKLPEKSVDLILTSPPFLALRSYLPADHPDKKLEGGSQSTPGEYIDWLIDVVEACDRVLAPHGSLCIELGDTYSGSGGAGGDYAENGLREGQPTFRQGKGNWPLPKSLALIPETFRFAMVYGTNPHTGRQTAPWRLRNVIRWVRPNPPVGALGDKFRPATSELMVFCKSAKRYFDLDAVREPPTQSSIDRAKYGTVTPGTKSGYSGGRRDNTTTGVGVTGNEQKVNTGAHPAGAPPLDWWNIPLLEGEEETRYGPGEKPKAHARTAKGVESVPRVGKSADRGGNWASLPELHETLGAPPLDWWNIPPGGYEGAHYAVWPPELCVKPVKAMCPEKVCRTCGEPSRPIREHLGRERFRQAPTPEEFAVFMREAMERGGKSTDEVAEHLGVSPRMIGWYRGTPERTDLPSLERWQQLTEILPFPRHLVEAMEVVDREYETWDQADRSIPERLYKSSNGPPKIVQTGFSDCSHDDWRPGLILDPFAGSGTTLAVATGHGRDAIGIDLDERNYELALQRVGPFILERAS